MFRKLEHDENRVSRICYIIEAALAYFVSILVTGTYLARITTSLGFSDSLTGILSSFVSLGCVFQLGAIGIFGRFRSVKWPVIISNIINQALFAFVYFVPVIPMTSSQKTVVFLVGFCAAFIILNLSAPQKVSWLMGKVADRSRGIFTARMEIVSLLSGMIFTFVAGRLIDTLDARGDKRMVFIIGGITIVAISLLHTIVLACATDTPQNTSRKAGGSLGRLLRDKMFVRIVLIGVIWHMASGCAQPFYGAYQIKELGFSMTFVSVLSIAYSVVRVAFSPMLGRYADKKSFSHMAMLCYGVIAAGFFVNVFTVPSNGRMLYTLYYVLSAVAMAGINSSLTNLVYDYVQGDDRRNAVAINASLGGVAGFLSTCLMSPVVARIQANGNSLMGISLYPAQFVSAVAFVITVLLVIYMKTCVIKPMARR